MRKLLDLVEKRAGGSGLVGLTNGKGGEGRRLRALERSLEGDGEGMKGKEEVILKATNRAIEKALGLAVFFQGQGDCRVCLRTGTVGTVDDILEGEGGRQSGGKMKGKKGKKGKGKDGGREGEGRDVEMEDKEPEVEEEFPETRIRKVSVLEVAITMK